MIIELSYPSKDLMPNRKNGKHWGATLNSKATANYSAYILTKLRVNACNPIINQDELIPLTINFVQTDNRKRDLDNLLAASKASIDGIAKGLGIDDRLFEPITLMRSKDTESKMIVKLELKERLKNVD